MPAGELAKRLAVAAVGIPLLIGSIYLGGWVLGAVLAAVAMLAALELYRMAEGRGIRPFRLPGAAAAAALVLATAAWPSVESAAGALWTLMLLLLIGCAIACIWLRGPGQRPAAVLGVTLLGALLPGATLGHAIFLRHLPPIGWQGPTSAALVGTALVLFPVAITWANDTCAYAIGTRWGRRKLIPAISPKKTVEGAVAGVVGAGLIGAVFGALVLGRWLELPVALWAAVTGGVLLGMVAQLGDLVESLLKREAGVKDSGAILPGHGGVLDRFDALFFVLPVSYWYFNLLLGPWRGGAGWL